MTNIIKTPKIVLCYGITAITSFIACFFISGSLDISMRDTYFVISNAHITLMIALLFTLFTLISWGYNKNHSPLSPILNWLHFGLTLFSFIVIAVLTNSTTSQSNPYEDYSVLDTASQNETQMTNDDWLAVFILILIIAQLMFATNIIRAFLIKRKG